MAEDDKGTVSATGQTEDLPKPMYVPTPDWRTLPPPGPRDSDLYAEGTYGEEDVTWWDGRNYGGVAIGLLTFRTNTPFIPGNINNATTFDFPVITREVEPENVFDIFNLTPKEGFTDSTVEACKWLEMQGVRAIIGGCGFFGTYQRVVQANIDTPFFGSSLMLLPQVVRSMPRNKKVGVITANQPTLEKAGAIEATGLSAEDKRDRIVIEGAEKGPEFGGAIMSNSGRYNPAKAELDVVNAAKRLVDNHDIGAIFLECSELGPHAHAVQKAVRLPVWDYASLAEWVYYGCVRKRFYGIV